MKSCAASRRVYAGRPQRDPYSHRSGQRGLAEVGRLTGIGAPSRLHFKRIAARAMRQLLVESARRRHARKRGGEEDVTVVTFDESMHAFTTTGKELLALDAALDELARLEPRQAAMVESRFFGGLDITEIAALLGVSEATILRDWRAAKAWLAHTLDPR